MHYLRCSGIRHRYIFGRLGNYRPRHCTAIIEFMVYSKTKLNGMNKRREKCGSGLSKNKIRNQAFVLEYLNKDKQSIKRLRKLAD